jgi:predicted RNA-binding protein YlxR (DUF448 family)
MRKIPSRMSFCSLKRYPRSALLRFVVNEGKIQVDEKQILPGRGAYLLLEEIPAALQKKAFNKALKRSLSKEEEEAIKDFYERHVKA